MARTDEQTSTMSQERQATGYPQQQQQQQQPPPPFSTAQPTNGYPPTSATGYPYAAPPPQGNYYYSNNPQYNPNPNYYPQQQQPYSAQRNFLRRMLAGVVAVFLILAIVFFIVWLVVRPKSPDFHLNSLTVSNLNATGTTLSGNWTAKLTAYNPNSKMHVYYEEIDGFVYYKKDSLAQNQLAPFDQGTKSQTDITATIVAASSYAKESVVNGINDDKSTGSVNFNVRFVAVAHFKTGGWRTRRRLVRVFCENVKVGMSAKSSIGSFTGMKDCDVSI